MFGRTAIVLALAMFLIGSVCRSGLAQAEEGNEADIAAIEAVIERYAAAVEAGDTDLYLSCWDENGVQMPPDAPVVFGKDNIGANTSASFEANAAAGVSLDMNVSIEEAQVPGDWAFTRGTYTVAVTSQQGEQVGFVDGKVLTSWKRQTDVGWKVYIDCFNSNVPPAPVTTAVHPATWGQVKSLFQE